MSEYDGQWHTISELLTDYFKYQQKVAKGEDEISVPTGLTDLDSILGNGLHPQDLIIIAARPSMGKSALAMNMARHVAINEEKAVAYFSLEMGRNVFCQRLLSSMTGINTIKQRLPQILTTKEWASLLDSVKDIDRVSLYLNLNNVLTPREINERVSELASEKNLGLVVVDFFQMLNIETTYDSIKEACMVFKNLAMEFHVPVVLLSQLSRKIDGRALKCPILSDLRGAGAIEEIADVILFLYREEMYNLETKDKGIADIIVAKHKEGPTGMVRVKWLPEYMSFFDLSFSISPYKYND